MEMVDEDVDGFIGNQRINVNAAEAGTCLVDRRPDATEGDADE